jgi:hypothetical protein
MEEELNFPHFPQDFLVSACLEEQAVSFWATVTHVSTIMLRFYSLRVDMFKLI